MGKNSFLLYLGVGFTMTLAVWGLMGGCSSEKKPPVSQEEQAASREQVKSPPVSQKKLQAEETPAPAPVAAPVAPATPKIPGKTVRPPVRTVKEARVVEHVVSKGDTLWSISQKYHAIVEDIMELNQMKNMNIHVGQKLRIKTKVVLEEEPAPAPAPVKPPAVVPALTPAPAVQPIAAPTPVAQPVTPAPTPAEIKTVVAAVPAPAPAPVASVAEKPAKKEEAPQQTQPYTGELLTHEVKDGETLATIAKEYKTSKSFLLDVNGLTDNSELQVGQILLVPEKGKS